MGLDDIWNKFTIEREWGHGLYYYFKIKNIKSGKVAFFRAKWEDPYSRPYCYFHLERVKIVNKEWVVDKEFEYSEKTIRFKEWIKSRVILLEEIRFETNEDSSNKKIRLDEDLEECFNESYF